MTLGPKTCSDALEAMGDVNECAHTKDELTLLGKGWAGACCHTQHLKDLEPNTNTGRSDYLSEVTELQQRPQAWHPGLLYMPHLCADDQHKEAGWAGSAKNAASPVTNLVNDSDIHLLDIRDSNLCLGWGRKSQAQIMDHDSHWSCKQRLHLKCQGKMLLQHLLFPLLCHTEDKSWITLRADTADEEVSKP